MYWFLGPDHGFAYYEKNFLLLRFGIHVSLGQTSCIFFIVEFVLHVLFSLLNEKHCYY